METRRALLVAMVTLATLSPFGKPGLVSAGGKGGITGERRAGPIIVAGGKGGISGEFFERAGREIL